MSAKKKKYKPDDKDQSARFIDTAKLNRADNAKEKFEETFLKILKPKKENKSNR